MKKEEKDLESQGDQNLIVVMKSPGTQIFPRTARRGGVASATARENGYL